MRAVLDVQRLPVRPAAVVRLGAGKAARRSADRKRQGEATPPGRTAERADRRREGEVVAPARTPAGRVAGPVRTERRAADRTAPRLSTARASRPGTAVPTSGA